MIKRTLGFNSTLHTFSKKRMAEIESGVYKPKPRKPIKQMSNKTKVKIQEYRKEMDDRCFLCGRQDITKKTLDGHHVYGRQTSDDVVALCNRFSGCKAHNHCGKDERFYELQKLIEDKR